MFRGELAISVNRLTNIGLKYLLGKVFCSVNTLHSKAISLLLHAYHMCTRSFVALMRISTHMPYKIAESWGKAWVSLNLWKKYNQGTWSALELLTFEDRP